MRIIDFVITGVPRSGTMYISDMFNRMGIRTGHERYFNWEYQIYKANNLKPFGDSSWAAAPYLKELPKSTVVLHQTRDSIKTIESLWGHASPSIMSGASLSPYAPFIKEHCPGIYQDCKSEYGRLIRFYHDWTSRIIPYADFTYDVSELADPYFLQELVYRASKVKVGLAKVKRTLNTISPFKHSSSKQNKKWVKQYVLRNPQYKKYFK